MFCSTHTHTHTKRALNKQNYPYRTTCIHSNPFSSFWACSTFIWTMLFSPPPLGSVQNRSNQSKPMPSTHPSRQKSPFQTVSSPVQHKRWNVIESNFLPSQNTHFHTTHEVKLCPKSLNRNLKAILFLEMETTWNIMISLDCTLASSLNTMSH